MKTLHWPRKLELFLLNSLRSHSPTQGQFLIPMASFVFWKVRKSQCGCMWRCLKAGLRRRLLRSSKNQLRLNVCGTFSNKYAQKNARMGQTVVFFSSASDFKESTSKLGYSISRRLLNFFASLYRGAKKLRGTTGYRVAYI